MAPRPRPASDAAHLPPPRPHQPSDVEIGVAIRRMRLASGLTLSEVAAVLGVTYQQVQNYEKGSSRIAASTLKTVADLFRTPIAAFFERPASGRHG